MSDATRKKYHTERSLFYFNKNQRKKIKKFSPFSYEKLRAAANPTKKAKKKINFIIEFVVVIRLISNNVGQCFHGCHIYAFTRTKNKQKIVFSITFAVCFPTCSKCDSSHVFEWTLFSSSVSKQTNLTNCCQLQFQLLTASAYMQQQMLKWVEACEITRVSVALGSGVINLLKEVTELT